MRKKIQDGRIDKKIYFGKGRGNKKGENKKGEREE